MAGVVSSVFGSSTEYFAAFGGLAASYLALKVGIVVLNIVKTYVLGRLGGAGNLIRFKGQWAGSCVTYQIILNVIKIHKNVLLRYKL